MKRLKWFFKLCSMSLSMCWRGYISYMGWSALVHGIGLMIGYLGEYVVLYTMIRNFNTLGGFSGLEVCFLYALGLTTYALGNVHTRKFWRMDELVLRGRLDMYLIRPVSPLLQLFTEDLQVGYLSHLVLGVGSMLLVKHMTGLTWSAVQWLLFVYALLAGGVLMGGISLLLTPLSFWWGESGAVTWLVRHDVRYAIRYPVTIYPKLLRGLLFVLPYAFVNYYPCLYLLNKSDSPFAAGYVLLTLPVGILVNIVFVLFWRAGLKRYSSAGG